MDLVGIGSLVLDYNFFKCLSECFGFKLLNSLNL